MRALFRAPASLFALALLTGYTAMSFMAYSETGKQVYLDVTLLSLISAVTVYFFSKVTWLKGIPGFRRIPLNRDHFLMVVFSTFFVLATYLVITAPGIPLLAWATGADPSALVILREEFLKARGGWESVLPYANSVLAGAFIPYAIAEMFINRHRWRWVLFACFFAYCLIFIEKVFFLKAVVPLVIVLLGTRKVSWRAILLLIAGALLVLYGLGYVSGFGSEENANVKDAYFSNTYRPSGTLEYLIWRSLSVPVFTAADTLSYFLDVLRGNHLLGATSGAMSLLFGQDRIYLERDVFNYQWGQTETGTGSSNAVYFIDAFVNFGFIGVLSTSIGVAVILKYFSRVKDRALYCLWPLVFFGFYVSGFIGNLLSGGVIFILIFSIFFRLEAKNCRCKGDKVVALMVK